ncbi:MAG: S-layer homology domain-containing protein [Oscillospiraceae bacterium]|jgi:hypothetical protein|nr:S-layer homology domain-containing protein [Oscillospiraceae bacterium]
MKIRRFITALLTLAVVLTFLPEFASPASALYSSFTDISGHWAEDTIDRWAANGVLLPEEGSTRFRPNDNITRGELALFISRMMNFKTATTDIINDLADVQADIADAMRKCYYAGVMVGDNPGSRWNALRPNDPITRQEAMLVIANAMEVKAAEHPASTFNDNSQIAEWARPKVLTMADKGWIAGISAGVFAPLSYIDRASVIKLIDNIIVSGYFNTKGVMTTSYLGNAVVTADGVEIKDATITGDLIITEGVGDKGKLTLTDVTIGGTVWLNGGGSLIIAGQTRLGNIQQNKKSKSPVDITGSASTIIESLYIPAGSSTMTLTGAYRNIEVKAPNYTLNLKNATITNATFDGYEQTIVTDANSYISTVTVRQPLKVKGTGKLGTVALGSGASGSSFDNYPVSVTVPTNTTVFLKGSEYYNGTNKSATYTLPNDQTPPDMSDRQVTPGKITDDTMVLSWKTAGDNVTARSKLRYMLYYSENKYGMDTVAGIEQNGIPVMASFAANTLTATAKHLKTNVSKYTFNVVVVDEAGNKACYDPVSIGLTGDNAEPVIREPRISVGQLDAKGNIALNWERAEDDVTEPQHLKYTLYSSTDPNCITLYDWLDSGTKIAKAIDVEDLITFAVKPTPNMMIFYTVVVSDNAGNKSRYGIAEYASDNAAPLPSKDKDDAPTGIINTDGTATLTWGEADDSNGGKYTYFTPQSELWYYIYRVTTAVKKLEDLSNTENAILIYGMPTHSTIFTDLIDSEHPNYAVVVSDREGNRALISVIVPAVPK